MLDIKYIRENLEQVKKSTEFKHVKIDFDRLIELDTSRREQLKLVEEKKSLRNNASESIAKLKKEKQDATSQIEEMRKVSSEIKDLDQLIAKVEEEQKQILLGIPNIAHESVPEGFSEEDNKVLRDWGVPKEFSFEPKDHFDLGEGDYLDFKRGAKLTGTGFSLFKGFGARLERALINFMLDFHIEKHAYTEISPPFVVNRDSMIGTGQLPKMEEDMYCTDKEDDLFLIPTAEVPLTNIFRNEILQEKNLPIYYVGYTPCFRREAGSYGKDTRGLSRLHQFDKVELVKFVKPEDSYNEHEALLRDAEDILQALGLHYRVLLLSAGDMSFAAAKCYDLEVWAPASKKWLEVSSCSNFESFQARRANIKYRNSETGKTEFLHTLNASGVALPRLFIALTETYQQEDGTFNFPEILKPYLSSRF